MTLLVGVSLANVLYARRDSIQEMSLQQSEKLAKQRLDYTNRAIDDVNFRPKDILIVSHRACKARFPENSLAAIAACAQEGAHIAEIDLDVSKDGEVIVMHDDTVGRVTNQFPIEVGGPKTSSLTTKELQERWLVMPNSGSSTPYKIPTFGEALRVARSCGIVFWIDMRGRQAVLAEPVASILNRMNAWDLVVFDNDDETVRKFTKGHLASREARVRAFGYAANWSQANQYLDLGLSSGAPLLSLWEDFRLNATALCALRRDRNVGLLQSVMWQYGEFNIRNPVAVKNYITSQLQVTPSSKYDDIVPCPRNPIQEDPCFGSHLYIPLLTETCARFAFTDMPTALRSSLLKYDHTAPPSIWPLDPPLARSGATDALPLPPQCLVHSGNAFP